MRPEPSVPGTTSKHRQVYSSLSRDIHSGRWKLGERLPSEAQLVLRFGVSRITIGRAVRDLQAAGLVERRGGSRTFVKRGHAPGGCSFGPPIPHPPGNRTLEPHWEGAMAPPPAPGDALPSGAPAAPPP